MARGSGRRAGGDRWVDTKRRAWGRQMDGGGGRRGCGGRGGGQWSEEALMRLRMGSELGRGERRGGKTKATRPRGSGVREGAGASSGLAAEKGTDCCPPGWWRPAVTSGHRGGDRETEGELLEAAKGGKEGRKEIQDSRRFPGTRRLLPEAPVTPSTADNSPAPQPLLGKGPAVWHSEG